MVGPRTRTALQAVGYRVTDVRPTTNSDNNFRADLRRGWRNWFATENAAWQACLDDLKANPEPLCSRMMATIASTGLNGFIMTRTGLPDWRAGNNLATHGESYNVDTWAKIPHDAVLALFLRVCCDPEDS